MHLSFRTRVVISLPLRMLVTFVDPLEASFRQDLLALDVNRLTHRVVYTKFDSAIVNGQ
jgi:hypothetical protein